MGDTPYTYAVVRLPLTRPLSGGGLVVEVFVDEFAEEVDEGDFDFVVGEEDV